MKTLKNWQKFNESLSISTSRINGTVFTLREEEQEKLTYVFTKAFDTIEDRINNAEFFNSGYKGISFTIDGKQYLLMYDTGNVGLEDQSVGGYNLRSGADVLIDIKDDYFSRSFGDVAPTDDNAEKMIISLKDYFKIS